MIMHDTPRVRVLSPSPGYVIGLRQKSKISAFAMLGLLAAVASFNAPTSMVGQSAVSSVARTDVSMSTKYTVAAGLAKKKNPKSGDSSNLKGYTVGSRAPDTAKNSGTTKSEQGLFECAAPHLRRSSHTHSSTP